jgi:hypothetical protein
MGSIAITLRGAYWSAIAGLTVIACAIGAGGIALAHYFVGPPLLAAAFALLAAASAFTLDESASAVVDVTPTDRPRKLPLAPLRSPYRCAAGSVC